MKRQRHHRLHNGKERRSFNSSPRQNQSQEQQNRRLYANATKQKERYLNMAKDAASGGDIIQAENFYQYADHFHRVILATAPAEQRFTETGDIVENWADDPENSEGVDASFPVVRSAQQPSLAPDDLSEERAPLPMLSHRSRREGQPAYSTPRAEGREEGGHTNNRSYAPSAPHREHRHRNPVNSSEGAAADAPLPPREEFRPRRDARGEGRRPPVRFTGAFQEKTSEEEGIGTLPFLRAPVSSPSISSPAPISSAPVPQPIVMTLSEQKAKPLPSPAKIQPEEEAVLNATPRRRGRPPKARVEADI
jgi:hypothetical protein